MAEFLPKMDERLLAKQLSLSQDSDTRSSTHSESSLLPSGLAAAPPLDSLDEEAHFYEGMGSLPDYDDETDLDSFLPDTMPSLSEVCDDVRSPPTAPQPPMHFTASHFRQDSSDSDGEESLIKSLALAAASRPQPDQASRSRPLAVGPRTSRHNSQGSDIDIDDYEVVDESELLLS